jgi:HSP20 family protein
MYTSLLRTPGDWFADFDLLQDRLDELLGGRGATPSSIRAVGRGGAFPALNVGSSADALEIYALAPGIDPTSIDVSVDKGLLAIAGERPAQSSGGDGSSAAERNVYANERFIGRFRRVVALPDDADPSRVEASYRDGVLKIVVPKRESSKPRRIAISSGN